MLKIGISTPLEKKLRAGKAGVAEILALVDEARTAKKIKDEQPNVKGLGYQDILGSFRLACGSYGKHLTYPPRPSPAYTGRICRRANELGMDNDYTLRIVGAAVTTYPRRTAFALDFLVSYGPSLVVESNESGVEMQGNDVDVRNNGEERVLTGRPEF